MADAKAAALGSWLAACSPGVPRQDIAVEGEAGYAALKMGLHMARRRRIHHGVRRRGRRETGVRPQRRTLTGTSVSEQYLLDLEREAFLSLCGNQKTQERMQVHAENRKAPEKLRQAMAADKRVMNASCHNRLRALQSSRDHEGAIISKSEREEPKCPKP